MKEKIVNYSKVEIIQKNPPMTDIVIISEIYYLLDEISEFANRIITNCEISLRYLSLSREKWPIPRFEIPLVSNDGTDKQNKRRRAGVSVIME